MPAAASALSAFSTLSTLAGALAVGCAPTTHTCVAPNECGARAACVAGRCQGLASTPAVDTARRVLVEPVAMAYVTRGDDAARAGDLPPTFTLGRRADGDARVLLRFAVPLARETTVVEAYLLLERTEAVESDPEPVVLHAARIVDRWDPRGVSWAFQPRVEETRAPSTTVVRDGRHLVRLDVRALVNEWPKHDPKDQGLAVLADTTSPTGVAFSFSPATEEPDPTAIGAEKAEIEPPPPLGVPPRLELYLKDAGTR